MNEYTKRINRVIDYIDQNLDKELTLEELADVSCFSRFHFNRIFSSLMGETLFQFIQRLRLEKAATLICGGKERASMLEIALDCGYSNAASFSKSFKAYHGVSPSQWKARKTASLKAKSTNSNSGQNESTLGQVKSNPRQGDSNIGKEESSIQTYNHSHINNMRRTKMNKENVKVEVKEIEAETIAYIRHVGPYAGDSSLFERLFGTLCQWAGPRDLIKPDSKFITIYHDNPEITEEEKLRISVSLIVPKGTKAEGDINITEIPGGKYAIGHFEIDPSEYGEAWSYICGEWIASSGYEPDDRPCFEMMVKDPKDHPQGKHTVDIYEPVKPM